MTQKGNNLILWLKSLEVYFHPKVIAVFMLGISSGLPYALSAGTLKIWLTEVGVKTSAIGYFTMVAIPYSLKFIWAPIIDNCKVPLLTNLLGRRRSWLVISQIALCVSIIMLGNTDPSENPIHTGIWAVIMAFFAATQDIVVDAYRIEILQKEQQGAGAASYIFGYRIGMLCTSAGAILLSQYYSWFAVYSVAAGSIVIGMFTSLAVKEPIANIFANSNRSFVSIFENMVISPLKDFITRPNWQLVLLFTIFFKLGDAMAAVMTETFLMQVGFDKSEIAKIVKLFGFWSTMVGVFLGGVITYRIGIIRSLWVCGLLQMLTNLIFVVQAIIGYSPELLAFTIGAENLTGGMGSTVFVAYLSSLCNISFTGTQFALLSSLSTIGRTFISAPSGHLVETVGWVNFFIITTIAALPGLILLYKMNKKVGLEAIQT
jgi:PAT family beta-lactamase induction signal transducer AmpG